MGSFRRNVWRTQERGWGFALVFTLLFGGAIVFGHLHHEMWRDELHCWGVGRAAADFWDVLTGERRYDGHPFLWYYLLHLASRLSRSYLMLHAIGIALPLLAAVLWLRYAPLPRLIRILPLPSYYLVYEYGVISRSYVLGIVFAFVFCVLYHPCRVRYVLLSFVLFLLAATSMYGTLMAGALGLFLFTRGFRLERADGFDDRTRVALPLTWFLGLSVFVLGLGFIAVTTWPPVDAYYAPTGSFRLTSELVRKDFFRYWMAMFPFRSWNHWDWLRNDWWLSSLRLGEPVTAWFGFGFLALLLFGLRGSPWIAISYAVGVVAITLAQHSVYAGGMRHLGNFYVLLLACVWLHASEHRGRAPLLYGLLTVNLCVQGVTGVVALRSEKDTLFSGATQAAAFIRRHHLEELPTVGHTDATASGIAIVLDRPFHFLSRPAYSDTIVEHNRMGPVDEHDVIDAAASLARAAGGKALIVLNYELVARPPKGVTTKLLYRQPDTVMPDESFRIYELTVPAPQPGNTPS